jgi:hypothetical protein
MFLSRSVNSKFRVRPDFFHAAHRDDCRGGLEIRGRICQEGGIGRDRTIATMPNL